MVVRSLIVFSLFLLTGNLVSAHTPEFVVQTSLRDNTVIEDPEISRAYYGELTGFPHTFVVTETQPFHLYLEILVPDIESSENNISGIIVRQVPNSGRVETVARMSAKDVEWTTFHEPFGNDTYRKGSVFEADLEPGTYKLEVSTPDNEAKYVFSVGFKEEIDIGYFETVRKIAAVKVFFGKSQLRAVESPLVYIPLIIVVALAGVAWFIVRKRRINTVDSEEML